MYALQLKTIKERPILLSGPMVRAVLTCAKCGKVSLAFPCAHCGSTDFVKTQTRRVMIPQPVPSEVFAGQMCWKRLCRPTDELVLFCPHGKPNDRLWCRETIGYINGAASLPKAPPLFGVRYLADNHNIVVTPARIGPKWTKYADGNLHKIPSIFMPRWASRITLELVSVRAERLQDISEEDAIAEGLTVQAGDGRGPGAGFKWDGPGYCDAVTGDFHVADRPNPAQCGCKIGQELQLSPAKCAYRALWDSINAKRGYSWDVNPWVWILEFVRL